MTSRSGGLEYRPALDGLRALAAMLVLVFHSDLKTLCGGFIGVDVFFVLSGYLVTSLIVSDLTSGRFRLTTFYSRRIRRLLPAALVVLTLIALIWDAIASSYDRLAILGEVRAAALYVANWHFAGQATDYFASNDNPTPVIHFWSLSVEEQFYLAWPLLILLGWRLARHRPARALHAIATIATVGAVASLVALAVQLHRGAADRAYFGTDTRAYQLLLGATIAVALTRLRSNVTGRAAQLLVAAGQVLGLLALLLVATSVVDAAPSVRGIYAAAATGGLLLTLDLGPSGPVARLLSRRTPVYLGQISYATYLWHWPVIVVIRRFAEIGPLPLTATAGLVSTGLAALSLQVLETPIRKSPRLSRFGRSVVVTGLSCSLLVGLVVLPAALRMTNRPVVRLVATGASTMSARMMPGADGFSRAIEGFDLKDAATLPRTSPASGPSPDDQTCTKVDPDDCIVVRGPAGASTVLLLGDSHAGMLVPTFRAIARREHVTLAVATMPGCPWMEGLVFRGSDTAACLATKAIWYRRVIPALRPTLIVAVSRATDHSIGSSYAVTSADRSLRGTPSQLLVAAAARTISRLVASGTHVLVEEPVPVSPVHAVSCLTGARQSDECSFTTDDSPSPAELGYRRLAQEWPGQVATLNLDAVVCPRLPVCDAVVHSTVVRQDHDHLTPRFAGDIVDAVDVEVIRSGLL